jgi:hypothetical protein
LGTAGDATAWQLEQYDRLSIVEALRLEKSSSRMAFPQVAQWMMLLPIGYPAPFILL